MSSCFTTGHEASDSFTHIIVNGDDQAKASFYKSYGEITLKPSFSASFLDRATQTSLRYIPKNLRRSRKSNSSQDKQPLASYNDNEQVSDYFANPGGVYTVPVPIDNRHSLSNAPTLPLRMPRRSVPLARSASYEKAILSSLKDYDQVNNSCIDDENSSKSMESCDVRSKKPSNKKKKFMGGSRSSSKEEENELTLLKYQELDTTLSEDEMKRVKPSSTEQFLKQLMDGENEEPKTHEIKEISCKKEISHSRVTTSDGDTVEVGPITTYSNTILIEACDSTEPKNKGLQVLPPLTLAEGKCLEKTGSSSI